MLRFIFLSMAFMAISFFAVPVYFGISKEHQKLTQTAEIETNSNSLSFKEIYALADASSLTNPAALNAISPAAGNPDQADKFSNNFSGKEDSTLTDIKTNLPASEETTAF